jgi:hypothetical protein
MRWKRREKRKEGKGADRGVAAEDRCTAWELEIVLILVAASSRTSEASCLQRRGLVIPGVNF